MNESQNTKIYNKIEDDTSEEGVELQFEDSLTSSSKALFEEDYIYPMKTITIDKNYYTAYELKRKYDRNQIILDSDFQRKSVWKTSQKRELIESILMGLPLPIFYFNEDKKGRLIVIDGRQRLTALFEFMDKNTIKGSDKGFNLGELSILTQYNKKKFTDLEPMLQSKIEDFQIIAHVIKPPTPEKIMYDIFDRVNRAGTPLNKQEIRNALYQGEATKILERISESDAFMNATENAFKNDKRMKDRYLVLRFIAFYLYFNKKLNYSYSSDIDELMGITMEYLNSIDVNCINEIEIIVTKALEKTYLVLGENAFRLTDIDENDNIKRFPININIFESILYAMSLLPTSNELDKANIKLKFDNLKNSPKFRDSLNNHRDSENKFKIRYEMIKKLIGEVL